MAKPKQLHQVIYKPDTQSTDVYLMIIEDVDAYKKYKDGDTSIPLAMIVDSFDIFHSGQGVQGKLGKASKQQLANIFDTSNEDECAKLMLEKGDLQAGEGIALKWDGKNDSRGDNIDTRGGGGSGMRI